MSDHPGLLPVEPLYGPALPRSEPGLPGEFPFLRGIHPVTDEDLKLMDVFEEDVPAKAFRQVQVTVVTEAGEKVLVTTYAATPIGKFKPKAHYLDWIMKGLKHWKLPNDCIEQWQAYGPK